MMQLFSSGQVTGLLFAVYPYIVKGAYETPLGVIPVDENMADEMKRLSNIIVDFPAAHAQEHSLEIQLPFLQVALGAFFFCSIGDGGSERCDLSGTC